MAKKPRVEQLDGVFPFKNTTLTSYDANTLTDNGVVVGNIWTNTPVSTIAVLTTKRYSNDWIDQEFVSLNIGADGGIPKIYKRARYNGTTWSNWYQIYHNGNLAIANYALKDGTNASGSWTNTSFGIAWHNPTITGKTLNGAGATVDLKSATQGTAAGMINTYGTADGNPDANWYHRLKMLHPNSAGYFTEIAVQMTGGNSLQYKRMEAGTDNGWIKVWDNQNFNPGNYATISSVNSQLSAYSTLAGTQTFTGQNTFSVLPLVNGTPTLTNHVINLGWIQSQNFHQQNLNIDVSEENGELRINPAEVLLEPQTGQSEFDGRDYYHRLVYVNIIESGTINLKNLQSRQRLVLFNNSDNWVEVDEDGITIGTLSAGEKVSVYKEEAMSYDYAIYYDKGTCAIGTF